MSTEEKKNSQIFQDSDNFYYPEDEQQLSEVVKELYKKNLPTEIVGTGSKSFIGNKIQSANKLKLSKLSGIIEYLPEELYIKVKACTPIELIEQELDKNNQELAFEPLDFGFIEKGKSNKGTIGGYLSCNFAGPRRFKVGSVRDHILGFRGVNGKGDIIKSGGTVVKNVTGYDLSKLIAGSFGTLVALTEVTLKVLPKKDGEEKHEIVEADHRRGSLWKIAFENMSDDMIVPIAILDWKSSHDTEEVLATITSLNNNSLPWKLFDYCKAFSHPSLKGKTSKAILDSYVEVFNKMKELGQARRVILTNGQVAQIYTSEFSGFEDMYKGRFLIDIDREEYTKAMLDRIPTLITKLGKKNFPGAFLRRYLFLLGDKCGTPGGVTSRDWWKGNKDSFAKWETFFQNKFKQFPEFFIFRFFFELSKIRNF